MLLDPKIVLALEDLCRDLLLSCLQSRRNGFWWEGSHFWGGLQAQSHQGLLAHHRWEGGDMLSSVRVSSFCGRRVFVSVDAFYLVDLCWMWSICMFGRWVLAPNLLCSPSGCLLIFSGCWDIVPSVSVADSWLFLFWSWVLGVPEIFMGFAGSSSCLCVISAFWWNFPLTCPPCRQYRCRQYRCFFFQISTRSAHETGSRWS